MGNRFPENTQKIKLGIEVIVLQKILLGK